MSTKDYLIRRAVPNDSNRIVSQILKHYVSQENIYQSYLRKHADEITVDLRKEMTTSLFNAIHQLLRTCHVLVVEHRPTDTVVGQLILQPNDIVTSPQVMPEYDELISTVPKVIVDLVRHIEYINKPSNFISDTVPWPEKSLKLRYLGVYPEHRKKGLSTLLLRAGLDYAKKNEFLLVHGTFSSVYSQRAAAKAGLTTVYTCDLNDIRDENGESAFNAVAPNNVVSMMSVELANIPEDKEIKEYLLDSVMDFLSGRQEL